MQIGGNVSESLLERQILSVFGLGRWTPLDRLDICYFGVDSGECGSDPAFRNLLCDLLNDSQALR